MNSEPDHRYSRQSYSVGLDTQIKLSNSSILVINYNMLAQEIIRNLILIGVGSIDIQHDKITNPNLYFDINTPNGLDNLKKLNPNTQINIINKLNINKLKNYNLIILTNDSFENGLIINKMARTNSIPFIMCGTNGLSGWTFNDFGPSFVSTDVDGDMETEMLRLDSIDGKLLQFKEPHKLSEDDIIKIVYNDNTEFEYKISDKKNPLCVELNDEPLQNKDMYVKITKNKESRTFNFKCLEENLTMNYQDIQNITFEISDWSGGFDRAKLFYMLNLCLDRYIHDYGSKPNTWDLKDYEKFYSILSQIDYTLGDKELIDVKKFSYTSRGNILPICSIVGATVSHEIFKVLAHKYIPIFQWNFMDAIDLITNEEIDKFDKLDIESINKQSSESASKYYDLINVFGNEFVNKLQSTVPFVIGSGAIGCELLKNLGMMGIKQIHLTDPDHIEKSNLSRQFLFDDNDIHQSKAETACKKIEQLNSDVSISVYKHKICPESIEIFNSKFHNSIDIYLNALDNVNARIYMDQQALKYTKPLIDSGTMGAKGNVQVIIPHLTESYASSKDPDDKAGIPICTIKSFPYMPAHTIQWARELFESEFNIIPNLINKYQDIQELSKLNNSEAQILFKQLYKYIEYEPTVKFYYKLLSTIYAENHIDNIKEIVGKYVAKPGEELDIKLKDELGDKKLPEFLTLELNLEIDTWIEYLDVGFNLLNQIFKSQLNLHDTNIKMLDVQNVWNNPGELKTKIIFPFDKLEFEQLETEQIIQMIKTIIDKFTPNKLNSIEFEKDNDELGHVKWINLASNMRNIQYSIDQTSLFETRKIAGNIIPALITTTSLIAGYQILEYIRVCKLYTPDKYLNKQNLSDGDYYRNRFVNLNINYCDGINPELVKTYKLDETNFVSVWTQLKTTHTNTLDIIKEIESQTKKKIEFMTMEESREGVKEGGKGEVKGGESTVYDGDDIEIDIVDFSKRIQVLLEDIEIPIEIVNN